MQSKMEVALAKERETLAQARAAINAHQATLEERVKATEEATRRQALDEFMREFRVEERSYMRETKSMFSNKRLMVLQERLYFRNLPLSNWVEHEMLLEEGADFNQAARSCSAFSAKALPNSRTVTGVITNAGDSRALLRSLIE
jgi:hypothetical protein